MSNGQPTPRFNFLQALKKFVVSAFVVFTFIAYTIHDRLSTADEGPAVVPTLSSDNNPTTPPPSDDPLSDGASQPSAVAVVPSPTTTTFPTGNQVTPLAPSIGITMQSNMAPQPSPTLVIPSATIAAPPPATLVPSPAPTIVPSPTVAAAAKSGYRDGQFVGDVTDAFYGYVQVKAVIQAGRITDVQFLQYPQDRRTSARINSVAVPTLRVEAIRAQNARVNFVSGATLTSEAFVQSLQSALNRAKA